MQRSSYHENLLNGHHSNFDELIMAIINSVNHIYLKFERTYLIELWFKNNMVFVLLNNKMKKL